jgi:prepilin-type N-terminal cleavage/methylation domain-containing protein/prepilin-type processing-associated H-X9-DG protein
LNKRIFRCAYGAPSPELSIGPFTSLTRLAGRVALTLDNVNRSRTNSGFTLVELLVTVSIVGMLASLVAPVIGKAKTKARAVECLNNRRQLIQVWSMYASDSNERLVNNAGGNRKLRLASSVSDSNWANNILDWELTSDNTNSVRFARTPLSAYLGDALKVFRCPADTALSDVQRRASWSARVRSVSMNGMVGYPGESFVNHVNVNNPEYRQFLTFNDIRRPASIFVFVDEHPDSINDGYFLNDPDDLEWTDLPGSSHNGGANFSFADAHAEMHRWRFASTRRANRPGAAALPYDIPIAERADFDWLASVTSVEW